MNGLAAKRFEVNAFMTEYWRNHPNASTKDACVAFMRDRGILKNDNDATREAVDEREAIQQESA